MDTSTLIENSLIRWESYAKGDILCNRFPFDKWHQIAGDIHSDKEWEEFVSRYPNTVKCWLLKRNANNLPIAFIYLYNEDYIWGKVSIHGGGWESPLLYYHGYIMMLNYLLEKGIKVRTSCQLSNPTAIRFSRSVGFVPYRYTFEEVFMWINHKRLTSTKLYKRFYSATDENSEDSVGV